MHWARSIALIALIAAGADALPGERSHVSLVPWKVVPAGKTVDAPLILYWVPSSRDELRRSPLLTSDELTRYSSRCVAMRVVRSDDTARRRRLHVEGELPVAVLADRHGRVIGTVESDDGALAVSDVEELVQEELDARVAEAELRLDKAHRHAENGDDDAALALYRAVWEERCLCPRQGKAAQRALRRMEKRY